MHSRILLGVAAWLVGASAATAGSMLAVSVLGQGMNPAAGEQVSVATVNRALAKESAERPEAMPRRSGSPPASPAPTALHAPTAHRPPAAGHAAPPPAPSTTGGTVFTSRGGTLVASCTGARAYLVSWSPQQGFGSSDVVRGPATNVQVTFIGGQLTVTMIVSCHAGAPAATTTAISSAVSMVSGDGE